jgi:hypothetical protein
MALAAFLALACLACHPASAVTASATLAETPLTSATLMAPSPAAAVPLPMLAPAALPPATTVFMASSIPSTTVSPGRTAKPSSTILTEAGEIVELIHADRVEYLEKERKINLTGSVHVKFQANSVFADVIDIDIESQTIVASGHLTWYGEDHRAVGSRMLYNMKTREGEVMDVLLTTGPWSLKGDKVLQSGEDTITVEPGQLTTCELERPHYSIKCRKIRIRLKRDLTAQQVTFLVGSTPVFWLPALVTPIREFKLPFDAQYGRTSTQGMFIRTSPAYSLGMRYPGQVHLDYFQLKGWGYGLTQEVLDPAGRRIAIGHGYMIRERIPSYNSPQTRWELFGEGSRTIWEAGSLSARAAYISDPYFRNNYGYTRLGLPSTAGERTLAATFSQRTQAGNLSVFVQRAETLRIVDPVTTLYGYSLSTIHAPQVAAVANPVRLTNWLSLGLRSDADRLYTWQNGWYVNSGGFTPSLQYYTRLPLLGTLAVSPRIGGLWRDRGDRILRASGTMFIDDEDINHGGIFRSDSAVSLRTPLSLGLTLDSTHTWAKKLNKIGYDPYSYHGLESHSVSERLSRALGSRGNVSVSGGYDLRNHQDEVRRRWFPVTPSITIAPFPLVALGAEGGYDVRFGRFRTAAGSIRLGGEGGTYVLARPRYTNNRLGLPLTTTTAQDYLIAQKLYGASYQSYLLYPEIFLVDGEVSFRLIPRVKVTATGQYDVTARRVLFYTLTATRNLHCWELTAAFQRYITGEYRFQAGLALTAIPMESIPLVGF